MSVNPDRYFRTLKTLDTFLDRALGLSPLNTKLSGFNYTLDLLHAALTNTYLETVGTHADSIHLAIKQVSGSNIPQKIPLISIPVHVGHNMAKEVCWCYSIVRPLVKSIKLILFDRGFYSKELMLTLNKAYYPYLIFVPKNNKVRKELNQMADNEKKKIQYPLKLNKNKTVIRGETTLALLKQIFDKRTEKSYDWAFATNQSDIDLDYIIPTYKGRWRIETGFRVQDEARIMSKSTDARIRFFFFTYEQVLQLIWIVLYKEEVTFKEFLLELYEFCVKRNSKSERSLQMATFLPQE